MNGETGFLWNDRLFIIIKVQRRGTVNDTDMKKIRAYIKNNHELMYRKWKKYSDNGYYDKE